MHNVQEAKTIAGRRNDQNLTPSPAVNRLTNTFLVRLIGYYYEQ